MKKLPIGIQTFEQLIQDNYLYIDKTTFVYKMITEGKAYFLSRPRRFGKSLLVSTLKAVFEGKKELFKGLALENKKYEWRKHPVIHIDFSEMPMKKPQDIDIFLRSIINAYSSVYTVKLAINSPVELLFKDLLVKLSRINPVVILIDEYDKPILDTLGDTSLCKEIKEKIKNFYTAMKACDQYIKFIFLTGVSKFAKISVFSGLNNLNDITMHPDYAGICGYSQDDLEKNFKKRLAIVSHENSILYKDLLLKIKYWYNGFRFTSSDTFVYNPISVLKLFDTRLFEAYWFQTATPTFIIDLIKTTHFPIQQLEKIMLTAEALDSYEVENISLEPLLFQTGYMTIKNFNTQTRSYELGYPNFEVKESFLFHLFDAAYSLSSRIVPSTIDKLLNSVIDCDPDAFVTTLQPFFAIIPYDLQIKNEKYYQTIFYLVFALLGLRIHAEHKTNKGRIDAVLETDTRVFIFEFKLFDTAENALKQIKEMEYYQKYLNTKKNVVLVGIEFSIKTRNIDRWIIEEISF